ncbi:MAG: VanW family protein [Clostridia bacterium]|nr:VanW family protein [Clostridia bacterium]
MRLINRRKKELIINKENINNDIKEEKKNKVVKVISISVLVILVNIIILLLLIACVNRFNVNVFKNIYFLNKNMSSLSELQVIEVIKGEAKRYNQNSEIMVYQADKNIYTIKSADIGFDIDIEKSAQKVMNFGRTGNILKDNYEILKTFFNSKKIEPEYKYDSGKLDEIAKNIDLTLDGRVVDDTYSVDEITKKLIIVKGKTGASFDHTKIKEDIVNLLKNGNKSRYTLNVINKKPATVDVNKVYSEVKRDAKDAYIDESSSPIKYVNEVEGIDFDVNELKNVLNKDENKEEGKTIEFSLNTTQPKVKLSDITYTLYKDKLDGYTTYFDASQKARSNNLQIALKYLNGVIVMPGEVFSYNKIIGDTTSAKGYLPAATFKGGKIVQELGGGICQTVSTLYNVALRSNLEIVQRHQHGLPVGYVPVSLDATVYGDVLDLKFKNTRKYPIKIITNFNPGGSLNVSVFGTKEDTEYDIILSSKKLYDIPYTTRYIYDSTLADGTQIVESKGVYGYASEAYMTKKLNGAIVSSVKLSSDVYKSQERVVRVGTKKAVETIGEPVQIY